MENLDPSGPGTPSVPEPARTVLLVEDDMELRTAMRDFLARSGFRVLEARDSYDALFLSAQYGWGIHLLITEINLLPVSGIKLAENILRLFPHIQVMCMSASEETRPIKYWMKYLNATFLPKPFSPMDLHEKVHALFGDQFGGGQFGGEQFEEAPISVVDERPAASARGYSSNSGDPSFWLKEF